MKEKLEALRLHLLDLRLQNGPLTTEQQEELQAMVKAMDPDARVDYGWYGARGRGDDGPYVRGVKIQGKYRQTPIDQKDRLWWT